MFTPKETRLFSKNGLDVQLVRVAGNVTVMALIAGESLISQVDGPAVVASNLSASDSAVIVSGVVATDFLFVSQKNIQAARQLTGGILRVSTLSGSAMLCQVSDRFPALRTGRIQATLLTPPHWIIAEREGFNMRDLPFLFRSISTTRRFIGNNPDTVKRFVKFHIDALHLMKTDRET